MTSRQERIATLLERLCGGVLAIYPAEFRHEYGPEMVRFFGQDCRIAARRRGLSGLLAKGIWALADMVISAPGVHMDVLRQDLRFAWRMLRGNLGFTLTAILTLALGIGANSAIFSLVRGILLAPLAFPDPDQLVTVWEKNPKGIDRNSVSPPNFMDFRKGASAFVGMAAFYESSANVTGLAEPEHLVSSVVTPEFFDVLGVRPVLGAGLGREEGKVVVSYGLWQRRFGGDAGALGRTLQIDDRNYTISGVMPADFHFSSRDVALWTVMPAAYFQSSRQAHFLSAVARLKTGVSILQARAEMDALAAGLARAYPASNRGWGVTILPLKEQTVGEIRRSLFVLMGAVGFILLIACANISNLLLTRGACRQGEIAVRTALGASSIRIGRQILTESVLLALIGAGAGLALCWSALGLLKTLRPAAIPRLDEVGVDGWVIAFTFGIAVVTGIVSGLAPVLKASRGDLREGLKEGASNRRSFAGNWFRGAFISSEIALCLLLLVGAGLLIRSFLHLQGLDPGFRSEHATGFSIDLPRVRYANGPQRAALLEDTLARVRALPGVNAAGMISNLPLTGGEGFNRFGFTIEREEDPFPAEDHRFYARWITAGYLESMGIPLLRGRDFTARDRSGSPAVVVIDAALARRYFPNRNPVGQFLRLSYAKSIPREIVGVAGEVRLVALEKEPAPQIYVPVLQEPQLASISLVVRASPDHPAMGGAVREEMRRVDRNLPVYDVRPVADHVAESIAPRRFNMQLMSLLAAVALALAAVGVYGVISYMVGERLREIGIRMALGAGPAGILMMVVRQGMTYAIIGIGGGLIAALALTKVMAGLLIGVEPIDAWTFGIVAMVTAMVACLACLVPAVHASSVDPAQVLKGAR